ncbi:MAG: C1 family peptidase [Crocinitomicaceae bacterium]
MPIRIRKDNRGSSQPTKKYRNTSKSGTGGMGAGMIGSLLPMAMSLFKKKPKLVLILAAAAAAFYFLGGAKMCTAEGGASNPISSLFSTGLDMDQKVYDKAEVFEPLADNIKNPMPEKVSLLKYAPKRLNQGSQGSCVGWSSGYAAQTILYSKATGKNPNNVTFSPSFLYNQIALKGCQGTYLQKAMELMYNKGSLPFSRFAYNENECNTKPTRSQIEAAANFRTKGFNRLSKDGNNYQTDLLAIKQNLAQGAPVVIGMMVGGTFMSKMNGKSLWTPANSDYEQRGFGGHAMCVIGYDDYKTNEEGAFQIMNSWGETWGDRGVFWIRYSDFEEFNKEAYGLYPMGDSEKFSSQKLKAEIGIVVNKTGKYIPFQYKGGMTFKNNQALVADQDFKIEITNSIECYVYVFGEETDGSSYTLFPYTPKHSPYCGITGTRLFPRDYSLYPDNTGKQDHIAIVISKQKLDFNKLNAAINANSGNTYESKVYNTLKNELIENVKFSADGMISFECDTKQKNAVALILELGK